MRWTLNLEDELSETENGMVGSCQGLGKREKELFYG
jgi:hypothetical protein